VTIEELRARERKRLSRVCKHACEWGRAVTRAGWGVGGVGREPAVRAARP